MTPTVLKNLRIIDPSRNLDETGTIIIGADGRILASGKDAQNQGAPEGATIRDCQGLVATPGLVDARVYVGEPGAEHTETIESASRAAAAGGITSFIMMPDTDPVIDDIALVEFVQKTARDKAVVNVHPAAALTKGLAGKEMTEIGLLQQSGAVAFTNGRHGLSDTLLLRRIMTYAREFDAVVSLELREKYLGNGVMNEGLFASWLGLSGVPKEAEIIPLERDLRIAGLTRAKYHAAKISVAESAEAMRVARTRGANATCGVSINHLALNENDIGEYRTFFKLSPPLRSEDDRVAMADALADGTIDIIVSSHDPQDVDTKRLPFADAEDGAIGLETLLAAALRLHHDGRVPLMRLIDAMSTRPAQIFGLDAGTLKPGAKADITLIDLDEPWIVSKDMILSRSKNTPFEDARFSGRAVATYVAGKCVYTL
ncbi:MULTISPECIES: dihydroorotase [Neorhizobium]|uniref:Dihydroorotase, multifunctional complex type n=1 Tax=Neorhizobium galegae bv. orientalis str. HAMBI 540 TaxID=1028800 RepID=A0A068SNL8_NEOGA|nr:MULTISPECIES: dihydroorotase [Neorhizobium]MCJ9672641.1 dihydroorotase [Neorhizobium sp. SHOUNA12B]MCJ9746195.1 dihydroorotase [Neorhizobium sp. SHOUNA12A]MCQ1854127.1 dihydroorotase [Neorhizobium galegae]CDN47429.1 Dihydroorotase, multifunctional complex type [Neorhizobium galegae bv. orientalis str. HAMBI 540]CDZ47649.1 Dihydroorotase [Neorhizobium galegae bv. orientalis]